METIEVSVKLPETVLHVAKVREKELGDLLRHSSAIELYRRRLISLGKAAEIAGISTKSEMMYLPLPIMELR